MFNKKKAKGEEGAGETELADKAEEGGGEEGGKVDEAGGAPAVGEMKRGDYMIHIFVEKAKEIKVPENSTVDPLIEITCLGQKKYTSAKDDIGGLGEVVWTEHLFLEPRNVEKQEAEDAKIVIKLNDKGFLKDTMIGQFEFDLSYIYFMKDHLLLHQWIAFSDPNSENYSEITGYLKVSISVAATGDEQVQINEDDEGGNDDNVMMPPQLNPKFYQVKIRFFQAQDLPAMDMGIKFIQKAKIDAYVMTMYKKKKLKTKVLVMEEGGEPIDWNQEFWLPAQIPIISGKMVIKLMDRDDFCDETVGSLQFDLKDIIDGKLNGKFVWKNVYGSPLGQSDSAAKRMMNDDPELASFWKGRILMQIVCEETEKPIAKVEKISDEVVMLAKAFMRDKEYDIIAEVGQAVALPKNKKYSVKIIIGGHVLTTKEAKVQKKNYNRFNERFEQQTLKLPYVDIEDFGNIVIILLDDEKPVCFYIEHISSFLNPNATFKWVPLKPDPAVNAVKNSNDAGMLSFKISIHDCSANGAINFKDFDAWKKPPAKRAIPVMIRAYIYQCRDLPAADSNGTSDPFVKVWDMSEKQKKTQVIEDNTNPLYFEVIELEYEVRDINDLESYPPFIFDVFDEDVDLLDSSDDFLARAIIEPENCAIALQAQFEENKNLEIPATPRWHPMRFAEGEPVSGEILVSFSVSEIDYNYVMPAESVDLRGRVEFKEMDVNMLILGLRALQSPGILPVKKAFVQFNIKSLVPPNSSAVQNIKTQPSASGPNPTLNTTMAFSIPLPTDPLYCPKLSCAVYDYIFKGFNQPMIGVFTVPIGQLMLDLKEERKSETAVIQRINEDLEKILKSDDFIKSYSLNNSEENKVSNHLRKTNPHHESNVDMSQSMDYQDTEVNRKRMDSDDNSYNESNTGSMVSSTSFRDSNIKGNTKRKANAKIKNEIEKSLRNSSIKKSGSEALGANEEDGINNAFQKKEAVLLNAQKIKQGIMNKGGNNEDDGAVGFIQQSRNSMRTDTLNINKNELKAQLKEASEIEKRIEGDDRMRAQEELNREGGEDCTKTIIMPKYQLDQRLKVDREVNPPPDTLYIPLGWDEDQNTKRKHYRFYYNDELENDTSIFPVKSPFNSYELKKGQTRGLPKGGLLSMFKTKKKDESGQESTEQIVGFFKGLIEIESKEDKINYKRLKTMLIENLISLLKQISKLKLKEEIEIDIQALGSPEERRAFELKLRRLDVSHLNITKHLANLESDEILKRQLLAQNKCIVRLYMISAYDLASRDNGSPSDSYLYLTCNGKIYNERNNYQLDEANPKFYKYYDFEGTFPGCSPLQIDVFDYDEIFGDDLIGTTIIDLEDRYFTMEWQSLKEKPIEYRQVYHNSSSMSQGVVKCWVEINSVSMKPEDIRIWEIYEKPPEEFEVRICVFNAIEIPMMDWEGTSDVYFRGFFDSKEEVQETDTHFRNQDGKPDFQYRLVFRIKLPRKDFKFSLQAFDRDFFKGGDMIGEASINLKQLLEDCSLVKKPLGLNKSYYNDVLKPNNFQKVEFDAKDNSRFWMTMQAKDPKTGKVENHGKVKVQIDVLPADQADKNAVGKARQEPNHSPSLPPAEGRISLSLNPMKMFNQMVGPEVRRKIYLMLCTAICLVLCAAVAPNVIGGLVSNFIASLF